MTNSRHSIRTAALAGLLLAGLAPGLTVSASTQSPASKLPSNRPNILILMADDQSYPNFTRDLMPLTYGQLVDKGVNFSKYYTNNSLCCPARSQIMTGLFEHHTGVDNNEVMLDRPDLIQALHDLGYRTSMTGKYLNSEPCDPLPWFDNWICNSVPPSSYSYQDPYMNENGTWVQETGYTTDILASYTADFITSTPTDQPFFAMYTPTSPHLPANDTRCKTLPVDPWRPPSYNEDTQTDGKPAWMARGPMSPYEAPYVDNIHKWMTNMVKCLDDSMNTVLSSLDSAREQNTLVIYISDNGYLYGEHSRWGKRAPYEEAVHVPMVVRYPPLVPENAPFTSNALVENVDIASTIADLLQIHWGGDGKSFVPLLTQSVSKIHNGLLLEECQGASYPCNPDPLIYGPSDSPSFWGIVTKQYKYIEYYTGEKELYDLNADPYEMTNHAGDPLWATIQSQLASQLATLKAPPKTDTTIVSGPTGALDARTATFTYFSQSRVATYQCRVDRNGHAGKWVACNGGSVMEGPLSDGSYVFKVRGRDENGVGDSTPDSRAFTIATTGPDAGVTSGPPPHSQMRTATFTFTSFTQNVTFECSMETYGTPDSFSPCTSPTTYTDLDDGDWSFKVRAVDSNNVKTDPPAERATIIDHAGPTEVFTQTPAANTQATTATFYFQPDEPVNSLTCQLDGGASTDCLAGTYTASSLSEGGHTLTITGVDKLGNSRQTTDSWTVDTTKPITTVIATVPNGGSTKQTTITFTITANENLDGDKGFACALDGQNFLPPDCHSPLTLTGLLIGPHTFAVVNMDRVGKVSIAVIWNWTITP